MIVGIDNGLDGGIVVLSTVAGIPPVSMMIMPTFRRNGAREVDPRTVVSWIASLHHGGDGITFGVEEPLPHAKSASATKSMWFSFGLLLGALAAHCRSTSLNVVRVPCGNRVAGWQAEMLGRKVPKGKTKAYALAAARKIWPDETWLATARSKVPHAGLVDAALIAEFVRRKGGAL